ncbi:hypothetical protein [Chitinophaga vietnamensis]|uniref:hypothetical protein n=1 Tax=Chitinophaga vietnamensis TaxID=2593957 RepID=UPI0011776217|nr:hypothetical protein [Chitinophaga vietnamensis]
MKKSYYHTFGSNIENIQTLARLLLDKLDLKFEMHESDYIGVYLKYSGLYADKITIEKNFNAIENNWKEQDFKQYKTLIYVNNTNGKNADKLGKSKYLKEALVKIADIIFLKEKVVEADL